MENYVQKLASSLGFLSRLPIPERFFEGDDGSLSNTSSAFTVAGIVIALPIAFIAAFMHEIGVDKMLIAILVLAAQTFITGALHEDGLSDCADGFWGSGNKERILEIMRDSRLGAYGTLALTFSILIKFAALNAIMENTSSTQLFILLIAISGISRGIMLWHWRALPPAREDGVAKHVGIPTSHALRENQFTSAILLVLCVLLSFSILSLVFAILMTILGVYLFTNLVDKKIDGHTGDTIGATQQISEITLLLGFALWA